MTLQQLEYVVALDMHRHFGRAAQACHVTQPTLTMQLRKLEAELDVVLFDRQGHPVRPTADGARLIEQAKVVVHSAETLHALALEVHGGIAGRYHVGIIPTLAPYLLPLMLPRFASDHPDVNLVLDERKTGRIVEGLRSGELDLGILATPLHAPDLEDVPLFQEPFLAYLPKGHPLRRRARLHREDLQNEPIWVLGEGHCLREQALNLCDGPRAAGHENVTYESGSIETLKHFVQRGSGMTLVPELSVPAGDPHVRRFIPPEPVRQISLVVHRPFARRKLLDALAAAVRASVPAGMCAGRKYDTVPPLRAEK
ncbi:MAG: LysR family transcriptional regulator [Flavobacteriales bacterium]|nr:LysR family transcriptional regulator [Flavobacteriales bacterium]